MHARRYEHFVQQPLEADRQPQVAVMEERVCVEGYFVNAERPAGEPNEADLCDAKSGRHRDFTKMKPKAGGNIEVRVDVVDVVKTPEKRHTVIGDVPIVKSKVHEEKAENELKRHRQPHEMDHA